jgi:hypothetical protein
MTTARHLDYCPFCGEENDLTLVINDDTQFGGYVGIYHMRPLCSTGGTHAGVESVYELTETLIQDWNQAGVRRYGIASSAHAGHSQSVI